MSLLNRTKVRGAALTISEQTGRPFTRVSAKFVKDLEVAVVALIRSRVHSAPGKKTL